MPKFRCPNSNLDIAMLRDNRASPEVLQDFSLLTRKVYKQRNVLVPAWAGESCNNNGLRIVCDEAGEPLVSNAIQMNKN